MSSVLFANGGCEGGGWVIREDEKGRKSGGGGQVALKEDSVTKSLKFRMILVDLSKLWEMGYGQCSLADLRPDSVDIKSFEGFPRVPRRWYFSYETWTVPSFSNLISLPRVGRVRVLLVIPSLDPVIFAKTEVGSLNHTFGLSTFPSFRGSRSGWGGQDTQSIETQRGYCKIR